MSLRVAEIIEQRKRRVWYATDCEVNGHTVTFTGYPRRRTGLNYREEILGSLETRTLPARSIAIRWLEVAA